MTDVEAVDRDEQGEGKRTRREPKRPQRRRQSVGRTRLLETAERMFGDHGIDGVSMRQIVAAAGQANNSAIAHHFGSREALLQAVCDMRVHDLEAAHQRRLERVSADRPVGVRELLSVILLPMSDDIGEKGAPTFARFLSRLVYFAPNEHPMYRDVSRLQTAREVDRRLQEQLPHIPRALYYVRYRLVIAMFLGGIVERSRISEDAKGYGGEARAITEDLLTIAAAALSAPIWEPDGQSPDIHPQAG